MFITINLEIGHDASLRTKITPEGFTHDWEVFVKGCNGAEIHYYVEKVVFHLHETFPKPKRVVKEPPYSLRTSGYAGFNLPIDIYLRNNQEPKKIRFTYDLQLQPRGPPIHKVQKEKYVFHSPSEEFRNKLLKGGGIIGAAGSTQDIPENKLVDEKNQMMSKPKLSGSEPKKHKIKLDEPRNTDFLNLFGTPITKTTSKAPEPPKPKEVAKSFPKLDKPIEKEKSKTKSPHKDKEKDKSKEKDKCSESSDKKKEEKKKSKDEKSKDRDRTKEKSSKKDKDRDKSPRPRSVSPKRSPKRPPSPPPQKHNSSKEKDKEQSKEDRKDKDRKDEKKKKDKRDHKESKHKERDRDREHKEHKSRESKSSKDLSSSSVKEKEISPVPANISSSQPPQKSEKREKSKESVKEPKDEDKSEKSRSDKSEDKQKHKHKKRDRKEKREDKYSSKAEKKSEKAPIASLQLKEEIRDPTPVSSSRDTVKSNLFGSPKSEPPSTPSQSECKEKPVAILTFKEEDLSNDSLKTSSRESSPPQKAPSEPSPEPVKKAEVEKRKEESLKKREKKEKKKDKKSDRDHEKKRKRKSPQSHTEVEQPPEKVLKEEENNNSDDERKVSSTEDAHPLPTNEAEDYMGMLRDLQHKIMGLKDNSDLQKVVQLIAETGRYEVSAHTFDFDLCLLDRSTVKQLQDFFASIS